MQVRKNTEYTLWQQLFFRFKYGAMLLLIIIVGAMFLYTSFSFARSHYSVLLSPWTATTTTINGADRWSGDTQTTTPTFDFSVPGTSTIPVSQLFASYYSSHYGADSLGIPVTAAFPINRGWIQFFRSGALFMPAVAVENTHSSAASDPLLNELITAGLRDADTGIISLPLLQALITLGSQSPIAGDGSTLTYGDLRKATSPSLMVSQPSPDNRATSSSHAGQEVFVKTGTRAGKDVGHLIPRAIWNDINQSEASPQGWETDFGLPLTEALAFTNRQHNSTHHMLVQVFQRNAIMVEQNTLNSAGQLQSQLPDTGIDYLRTAGPPPVAISPAQTVWSAGNAVLLNAPGSGQPVAHVGQDFPLTLLGDTWHAGTLWYQAQWTTPRGVGSGWIAAPSITNTTPGAVPGWSSFDILAPGLAAYLASVGSNVNAVVYDVTRQRYYTYNPDARFIMGSSMKVPIMLTFLAMTEREGRQPTDDEMNVLTTMIENSNNDSASALYYGEIGGATGVASYLQRIGITGLSPDPDAWGYSLVSPLTMVHILTLLNEGKILNAQDRKLAFYLMEHIEPDQQVGVGDTAPKDAVVAMKDGWLPGPDGSWAMNSSGIVTRGNEQYIISVYTSEQNSLADGQAIARHVCRAVASLLI